MVGPMTKLVEEQKRIIERQSKYIKFTLISTLLLVVLTGWYAFSTDRMVNIMSKEFEISNRPYLNVLEFDIVHQYANPPDSELLLHTKIKPIVKNSGKTPARILNAGHSLKEMELSFQNNRTIIIFPNEERTLGYIQLGLESMYKSGTLEVFVEYTSTFDEGHVYETYQRYNYDGNPHTSGFVMLDSSFT